MYQSISFYRFYIGMIVTVKMSSSWPSSLLKTIFVEDNIDFTLSLISCHSLSSPKRLAHFRWTSLYLGWSIIIHWKKSLFTSDSLAQLSFKVACFVARGQKYSKFNFSRLSEAKIIFRYRVDQSGHGLIHSMLNWNMIKYYQFSIRPC